MPKMQLTSGIYNLRLSTVDRKRLRAVANHLDRVPAKAIRVLISKAYNEMLRDSHPQRNRGNGIEN